MSGSPDKVNDHGQILGNCVDEDGFLGVLFWDGNRFIDLSAIVPGGLPSMAGADFGRYGYSFTINNRGQVAFDADVSGRGTRALLFSDGVLTDLGDLGYPHVAPGDMNSAGDVVGVAWLQQGGAHGFIWRDGIMRDLGTFGGTSSSAVAINDAGMIVGNARYAGSVQVGHAFIHSVGRMVDLDLPHPARESRVADVNAWGVVVGEMDTVADDPARWFMWRGGVMRDLGSLVDPGAEGWQPAFVPHEINDAGQIIGSGWIGAMQWGALLTPLPPTGEPTRLVNVSVRAGTRAGEGASIAGFVLSGGSAPGSVLARVAGPGLQQFGVTGAAGDPRLDLFKHGVSDAVGGNNDWSTADDPARVAEAAQRVGAFALSAGSADAALLVDLAPAAYTMHATAATATGGGVALSEVYDASTDPAAARLTNGSMRVWVGGGEETAIVGFVLQGDDPARVLIRAVGPGLAPLGVTERLADPVLFLHREGQPVFGNDNWGSREDFPLLAQVSDAAGAFALADGSSDAALIAELEPGHYTVHVNGAGGGSGVALVEVYLLPWP